MSNELIKMEFTNDQVDLIKKQIAKGASDDELKFFINICKTRGLDPFKRHIYCIMRPFFNKETRQYDQKMSIEVSIDGFRYIADRTSKYAGRVGPYWCGEDGKWVDAWLVDKPPVASKVGVLRHDFKEPVWAVARFNAFAAKNKDGSLNPMWQKMPDHMIAKVAEMQALRTAFPDDLGGLYGTEEMEQANQGPVVAKDATSIKDFDVLEATYRPGGKRSDKEKMDQILNGDDLPDFNNAVAAIPKTEIPKPGVKPKISLPPITDSPDYIPDIFCDTFPELAEFNGLRICELTKEQTDRAFKGLAELIDKVKTKEARDWIKNLTEELSKQSFMVNA